jgi:GMP synthase (glutamine-hydrolysing)
MSHVLVLRHVPFEHLGTISTALDCANIGHAYADLYAHPMAPVLLDSYAGVVLMGGPMPANDNMDYIHRELQLIEQVVAAGKPVLGICLGAQLIAKAAGARVYRNSVKEIGWAPVYWTEAGRRDPLFAGLNQPENVLPWLGGTFDLAA